MQQWILFNGYKNMHKTQPTRHTHTKDYDADLILKNIQIFQYITNVSDNE